MSQGKVAPLQLQHFASLFKFSLVNAATLSAMQSSLIRPGKWLFLLQQRHTGQRKRYAARRSIMGGTVDIFGFAISKFGLSQGTYHKVPVQPAAARVSLSAWEEQGNIVMSFA